MNLKKPWQELHGSKKALRNGVYAALLTAVGLACGAGVILKVWTMLGGVII